MAAGVMAVIGLFIGVWGFLVMRNPYRLSILAPSQRGYYQRLVLDTMQRNLLRVLGAFICLFGSTISAHAIASVSKAHTFDAIGEALGLLLAVTFAIGFFAGVVITSIQTARGELLNWWRMWRAGAELGEVNVFPTVTPTMEKEARLFTLVLSCLTCVAVIAALLR